MLSHRFSFPLLIFTLLLVFSALGMVTFFRHDDWIMLGNAITFLPRDWNFLWESRLYFSPSQIDIWFFRPLFKLAVWAVYQLFGMNYGYWIVFQYVLWVTSVLLGGLSLFCLDGKTKRAHWFMWLALLSVSSYFANIVWMGEGMMNLPQLCLLNLCLFLFLHRKWQFGFLSLICYLLTLGFKESSVFFPIFLSFVLSHRTDLNYLRGRLRLFYGLMGIYLIWRLGFVPFNPGYKPELTWSALMQPALLFLGLLAIPVFALFLNGYRLTSLSDAKKTTLIFLVLFLGLLILPHLGHPFFSPGWFLLPGYFSLWALLFISEINLFNSLSLFRTSLVCLILSVLPIAWQGYQLRWMEWSKSQKAIYHYLKNFSNPHASLIEIESCPDPSHPEVTFERVVGAADNLEHLWKLYHSEEMAFRFVPCPKTTANTDNSQSVYPRIRWHFPNVDFLPGKT